MTEAFFFQDLAVLMVVAGVMSVVFTRLGWPKVIGYIVAGVLMSSHTWGGSFLADETSITTIGQLGIVFLMFSLGLSMSIDFSTLVSTIMPILLFLGCVRTACVLVHLLLCRIFRIDGGTALITNIAGMYGPPFISPVAEAFGRRELISPGIICAVVGLVIGNFLGIGIGSILLSLLPGM